MAGIREAALAILFVDNFGNHVQNVDDTRKLTPADMSADATHRFQPSQPGSELQSGKTQKACANSARARGTKISKNGGNLINFFSIINNATAGIPVSSNNFPTQ